MLSRQASVIELFLELVAVPSPSGRERALGEEIRQWLAAAGVSAGFDEAGAVNDSDCGNLIATVPGASGAPRLLFIAHMDTVESGSPTVSPREGPGGVIRSAGDTILGADNKSAVAAVMCLCRTVAAMDPEARPTVVAAFTCREESGRMGAGLLELDPPLSRQDRAFCVDGSKPIGTVITRALGQSVFMFAIDGRAAHAAADPGAGISAIRVAGEIVVALPLGRRPGGGSVNVAAVVGGSVLDRLSPTGMASLSVAGGATGLDAVAAAMERAPTNLIPATALLRGEVRAFSEQELADEVEAVTAVVARVCQAHGAGYRRLHDPSRIVPPFPAMPDSAALALVRAATQQVPGVELVLEEANATLEANYLARRTDVVAVASGGRDPHQTSESITRAELEQLEALLSAIVRAAVRGG